ncbi:TetR/AcrR family transcriptional regulator [Microbacterium terrisoli]|uniref:TetR/AcrR family transcriptional regulator n=1 Tax=Microbacterium terrisoli TaxID=3242192 RepID=UPI00280467D2|nr:helix-turn-helix domain-containing protein [Microbacterium protaetiae]
MARVNGGVPVGGAAAPTRTAAEIMDAAADEVRLHGIRRTTASDIARRAGVSRQTLYRYWPDVQSLLAALVTRELLAQLPQQAGDGLDEPTSLDGLVMILVDTTDRIRRMPLLQTLRTSDPELLARYVLEQVGTSQREIHAQIAARVHAGQAAGFVRAGDEVAMAGMVLLITQSAALSAPLVHAWLHGDPWRTELTAALTGYLR